jgi:hypothetical protein
MAPRPVVRFALISLLTAAALAPAHAGAAYSDVVLADGPDSYFRLDDATSTMVNATAQPDGTHVGDPVLGLPGALTTETPNLGIAYSDPDADRSDFSVTTYDAFSLEFFVITTQTPPGAGATQWYSGFGLVDGEVSGAQNDAGVAMIRDGHVGFGLGNPDTTIESTTAINDGDWHHVVATSDGAGNMKLYVDGVQEASATSAPNADRTNTGFHIGSILTPLGSSGQLAGGMDEVAFYRQALDQATVTEHFNAGLPADASVTFTVKGSGTVTGTDINCRAETVGTLDCITTEQLGTIRDYTATPDPGHRLGSFSFAGDCPAISANQCRVTVDKPGGESSLVTFYPQPALSAEQVRQLLAAVFAAISRAMGGVVVPPKKGNPSPPPAQLVLPPFVPPGAGQVGGAWMGNVRTVNGIPVTTPPPPAKIVEAAKGSLIGSDGGSLIGSDGGSLIGSDGGSLISDKGVGRRGALPLAASAKKKKKKKPKAKTVVLGTYVMPTDGSSIQPVLRLTPAGRKLLQRIGALNKKRKKKVVPNTSFLQVFQPEDKGAYGGAVTNIKLK